MNPIFLFALSLPKRGHVLRRLKIRLMNTYLSAEFGHVPIAVCIASVIATAFFMLACCSIFARFYH